MTKLETTSHLAKILSNGTVWMCLTMSACAQSISLQHNAAPVGATISVELDGVSIEASPWAKVNGHSVGDLQHLIPPGGDWDTHSWVGSYVTTLEDVGNRQVTAGDNLHGNYQSAALEVVKLNGITVPRATQIGTSVNWVAVKAASDSYDQVVITADLTPSDATAASLMGWTPSTGVVSDGLAYNVDQTVSAKTEVTATFNNTAHTFDIWVIWATLTIDIDPSHIASSITSGALSFTDSRLLISFDDDHFGPGYYNYDPTRSSPNAITASYDIQANYAFGKTCLKATITPAGINAISGLNATLPLRWNQKRNSELFVNGVCVPHSQQPDITTDGWVDDSPATTEYNATFTPDSSDQIYYIDGPGLDIRGVHTSSDITCYSNFYDYITLGGSQCSSTNNFWHCDPSWTYTPNPQEANQWGFGVPLDLGNPTLPSQN